jgi:UDP-GlcNAc3NAcA epimerase
MKIITVLGARPQFVKAAPISRAIRAHNKFSDPKDQIQDFIVHTGQHYDANMSEVFFEELGISPPSHNLGIGSGSHAQQTGQMLIKVEDILLQEHPDLLLIYGDTNSTLAGALSASKIHIPIAHIEAGLRSFNRRMPEEINRVLTDHMSSILFCPTQQAVTNLSNEGIRRNVFNVGDVMYDAFLHFSQIAKVRSNILKNIHLQQKTETIPVYYLATIHRAENTDDPSRLKSIFEALSYIDTTIVLPLHPRTRNVLKKSAFIPPSNVQIIDPVSYLDMCQLLVNAKLVLTDSGGLQKEAFFAQIPCVTLRDETEWTETVETGWNIIASADPARIQNAVHTLRNTPETQISSPYGSGQAASNIVSLLTTTKVDHHAYT